MIPLTNRSLEETGRQSGKDKEAGFGKAATKRAVNENTANEAANTKKSYHNIINFLYYIITMLSAWLILTWVKNAPDPVLQIMLYPHKWTAELFYHTSFQYIDGIGYIGSIGYMAAGSTYAISRECMGYNFMLMLFAMNSCTYVRYFAGFRKLLWLAASLAGAVLAGTFVSMLRILGSIPFSGHPDFYLIHLGIGVTIYLFVLAADYISFNKLFGRIRHEI